MNGAAAPFDVSTPAPNQQRFTEAKWPIMYTGRVLSSSLEDENGPQ